MPCLLSAQADATFTSGDATLQCVYRACSREENALLRDEGFAFSREDGVHLRLGLLRTTTIADLVRLNVLCVSHDGWMCALCLRFGLARATFRVLNTVCRAAGFAFRRDRGTVGGWVAPMTDSRMDLLCACSESETVAARVLAHRECRVTAASSVVVGVETVVVQSTVRPASPECELPEQKRARELMRARFGIRYASSGCVECGLWMPCTCK